MVLQAFIDESFKANGPFVLAGHIAPAEAWVNFSKQWEELLPSGTLNKYNKYHFKMSEMVQTSERAARIGPFYRILESIRPISIALKINITDIKGAMERIVAPGNVVKWTDLSDPFRFTFRAILDWLHDNRKLIPQLPSGDKIDFIFDNQSQKGAIIASWDEFIANRTPEVRGLYGSTPRFEDDNEFLPLQGADLWAGACRQWFEDGCPMKNWPTEQQYDIFKIYSKLKNTTLLAYYVLQ
jgi:hypothetical protein